MSESMVEREPRMPFRRYADIPVEELQRDPSPGAAAEIRRRNAMGTIPVRWPALGEQS